MIERPRLYGPPAPAWNEVPLLVALHTAAASNFCLWSYEQRTSADGEPTWTKVPKRLRGGLLSNTPSNAAEWMPLDDAFAAWRDRPHVDIHGLGFMLHGSGVVFIDLDGAAASSDPFVLAPWARQLVEAIPAYWEISPSGWGLKGWALGEVSFSGRRHILRSVEQTAPMPPAIELWSDKKYGCVTCRHLPASATEPPQLQRHLDRLVERYFAPRRGPAPRVDARAPGARDVHDEDWVIEHARAAANGDKFRALFDRGDTSGYASASEADLALAGIVRFWTHDPALLERVLRRSALVRPKWDESTYLELTLSKAYESNGNSFDDFPPWIDDELEVQRVAPGDPAVDEDVWTEPEPMHTARPSELAGVHYVKDLIRPGRLVVLGAVEGSGKSYFVDELAIRFSAGGGKLAEVWEVVDRGRVLLLSEMHRDDDLEYQDRILAALGLPRDALDQLERLSIASAAKGRAVFAVEAWIEGLIAYVHAHDVRMLIVDTVNGAIDGEPWGENLIRVFRILRRILDACPALVLVLSTHMKKPTGAGGKREITDVVGQWTRSADVVVLLQEAGPDTVRVTTRKRLSRHVDVILTQRDGLLVDPRDITAGRPPKVPLDRVIAAVTSHPGSTYAELGKLLEVGKLTAQRYVGSAGEQLRIELQGRTNTAHVFLAPTASERSKGFKNGHDAVGAAPIEQPHHASPSPIGDAVVCDAVDMAAVSAASAAEDTTTSSGDAMRCQWCGRPASADTELCADCESRIPSEEDEL